MTETAIYHPFIDLADARLLRTCVLYWDEIRTIVPKSIKDPYHNPVSKEAFDVGLLRQRYVTPDAPEVIKTGEEFLADAHNSAIKDTAEGAIKNLQLHRDKLPRLHPDKLSERVRSALFSKKAEDPNGFLRVTNGFGGAYMSRLATVISEADGTTPITDDQLSHDVVVDRYVDESPPPSLQQAESQLARLSVRAIQIDPATPLRSLVTFRERHRGELERYRRAIRKLARETAAIKDPKHFEHEIRRIVDEEIGPGAEELKAKFAEHSIGFGLCIFDIAQACLISMVGSSVGGITLGGAAAAVSVTIAGFRSRREITSLQRDHPFSYLFSAQGELRSASP